jgi:hypothetical protein
MDPQDYKMDPNFETAVKCTHQGNLSTSESYNLAKERCMKLVTEERDMNRPQYPGAILV